MVFGVLVSANPGAHRQSRGGLGELLQSDPPSLCTSCAAAFGGLLLMIEILHDFIYTNIPKP